MESYLTKRDWDFYKDANLTQKLDMDELRLGNHDFPTWADWRQHAIHCAYVWEKQWRATLRGSKMDDVSASPGHTGHCARGLWSGIGHASDDSLPPSGFITVKYFSCVKSGEGNTRRANNNNNPELADLKGIDKWKELAGSEV
jgi:hypothetical protein